MKNLILIVAIAVSGLQAVAQETQDRNIVKKGDAFEVTFFYENGVISQQGTYNSDGKAHGTWTGYDINGNKTGIAQYDNGKKTGIWFFYKGDVLKEVKYEQNSVAEVTLWKEGETLVVSN